jgi:plastocyanin
MTRRRRWMACVGVAAGCVAGTGFGAVQIATASATVASPATTLAPLTGSPATQPRTGATTTTTTTPAPTAPTTVPPTVDPFQPVPPGSAATVHVSIVDFGFSPSSITVAAGTTVTWTNTGSVMHSVSSNSGAFDSSPTCPTGPCISPGSSFSHVFAQAGSFSYHCRVHSNMTGTVIVNAAPGATTTTTPGTNPPATNPPVSGGGGPTPTTSAQGTGSQLAFTGTSSGEAWLALGALGTITLGLALRPRRRPFPIPASVPSDRTDRH